MKLAVIGVGQAGGKIVDEFLAFDAETGADVVRAAVTVNTAKADLQGIEYGRKWLEEQTGSMEVRGGDHPRRGEGTVAALVLLGGVTNVPRVKELQQVAIEA